MCSVDPLGLAGSLGITVVNDGRISPSFPPSANGLRVSSQLWSDYSNLIIGTRDLYNLSNYDQGNINFMTGLKMIWKPLTQIPEIGFSLEFLRKQTLNYSKSAETNPITLMSLFYNGFENSGSSSQITEYLIDHFNQYWNNDIEIENSRRQFFNAWSLRTGIIYDF